MSKAQLTIYRLEPLLEMTFQEFADKLINEFNESHAESPIDKSYSRKQIARSTNFSNVSEIYFYIGPQETQPTWIGFVESLIETNQTYINKSFSWILFIKRDDFYFCVTSGHAHNLISGYIDLMFGIEIFSRISSLQEKTVRSVTDKTLYGNRFSGTQYFLRDIKLVEEKKLHAYFKEISSSIKNEDILRHLGLPSGNGRDTITVVAKESLKVKKSIHRDDLNVLIGKICVLLENENYDSVNDFTKITNRNQLFNQLNTHISESYLYWSQNEQGESINFTVPLNYYLAETVSIDFGIERIAILSSIENLKSLIKSHSVISLRENNVDILSYLKRIKINILEDNQIIESTSLMKIIDYKVVIEGKNYNLIEGEWIFFKDNFIDRLNNELNSKVAAIEAESDIVFPLEEWGDTNEGIYNLSHIEATNFAVLDKILVDNIEICDLLWINNSNLYFIHVKQGLAGDTRILCEQIEISANSIANSLIVGQDDVMKRYYESIINKIDTVSMREQGEKFLSLFPSFEDFKNSINEFDIHFVFAYKANYNLIDTASIPSTPAKIAVIGLIENMKKYPMRLHFVKIN